MVALAVDRHGSHTGSGRAGRCCSCRNLDLSLSSGGSTSGGATWDRIVGGFQTRASTAACRGDWRTEMSVRKVLLIFVVLMSFSLPALAQSRRLMGGSAGGRKYQVFYETFLDPSMPELGSMSGGTIGGEGIIHRFMTDPRQRVFFGYDISVDVLPQSNTYRLTFNQLASESVRQILGSDAASWTQLPAPDWGGPAVRTIQAGDVLGLDLLTNNATGQKIVDYITVKKPSSDPDWRFIYETGTAQDFRAEDAALELVSPQVSVNEQPGVSTSVPGVNVYGAAVWFYLPGQGRF